MSRGVGNYGHWRRRTSGTNRNLWGFPGNGIVIAVTGEETLTDVECGLGGRGNLEVV